MRLLLDLFYLLALVLCSPWLAYRLIKTRSLSRVPGRFGFRLGPPLPESIWLHGSSVGEVSLLEPLVRLLEAHYSGIALVITSYTAAGVKAAALAYPAHRVMPFPFDLSFVHKAVLRSIRPRMIVVVESDLWPNHLLAAEKHAVPVAVINAKLSEQSLRLHERFKIVPRALRDVRLIAAQTEEHAARFERLGVARARIEVTGNMKYDLTAEPNEAGACRVLRRQLGIGDGEVVVIGGSLHANEDADLLTACRDLPARVIIVPRYPDKAAGVIENAERAGFTAVAKTDLDRSGAPLAAGSVLVVDTLGELRRFYGAADIAFVGGSLYYRGANKGGHNVMEPAILGLPVLFGPYNFSFKETVTDLIEADAGIRVETREELGRALAMLTESSAKREAMGRRAREVVTSGQGASARNFELLRPLIDRAPDASVCGTRP